MDREGNSPTKFYDNVCVFTNNSIAEPGWSDQQQRCNQLLGQSEYLVTVFLIS